MTLQEIKTKLAAGQRLSSTDGEFLFKCDDLLGVCQLADSVRVKRHGRCTYFNHNLHLNATNVCEADCIFCSFARLTPDMPQAYTMTTEEALKWIEERIHPKMTEVHIVNGLHPGLPFSYYLELLSSIKTHFPQLHIKAFTAVEIHYFAEKFGLSYAEVLEQLIEAGLGSMPGGGAEIFAPRARKKLCRDKVDAHGWLAVHKVAHLKGLKTNCTMLFGSIETVEERVDHLCMLRELQDETGGFQAFIPLAYHPENNRLGKIGGPTAADCLRTIAISRLLLDNISNIKAYWVMLGLATAQIALRCGANDIDGTVTEEKIYRMAGASSPGSLSVNELERLIRDIGCEPMERNTTYEAITRVA